MSIHYPQSLPISAEKKRIIETIREHQVVILEGDTGSGKTTQLPKMCLEAFPKNDLLIGCTQPRRIAATSVAVRVAEELGVHDDSVAYKIRFHDKTGPSTKIKFMTDGVLLAETKNDTELRRYGVIIVDEAHERSLNIDFILGYLKQLQPRRPDLKIIITSATIDTKAFSRHFDNAPIISIAGRTYPVTVSYQPPKEESSLSKENVVEHCVDVTRKLVSTRPEGDILVFLPTERDIRECCRILQSSLPQVEVLQLFGRLASGDQQKIFKASNKLKIIVATNVAETSLTVPGIRYVIDSGLARISTYNVRAKTTSLPITRISQASCNQRKGRCGRVGPGLCIRLYSEEDFTSREEFTTPEIKRSNLAEVILQMISLNLGSPAQFPFIDPPFKNAVGEGYRLLHELGAITGNRKLTARGKIMADLPIDPCISRIIIEASTNNCLTEIKIISSALAIQDPRVRPADQEKEADLAHSSFNHPHSDFSTLLNIWQAYHEDGAQKRSWSRLKRFCKEHFLSFQRMREWFDLHDQLGRIIIRRKSFTENIKPASYEQIHKSLVSGFLRNLAQKKQGKIYQGSHNKEFMIFPGSSQFEKAGDWIVAGSFIDTNRLYAVNVAGINSDWIEPIAGSLCNYSWTNPQWRKKSGTVVAEEKVTLFGLTLSAGRFVNFPQKHKKNIKEARDIFIQSALVGGELNGNYSFLQKNKTLIEKWQQSEDKLRVRNIVADDTQFFHFYNRVLPEFVCDQRSLNRLIKRHRNTSFLIMEEKDILLRDLAENELFDFPKTIRIGSVDIGLEYNFDPGKENDGVTFRLPIGIATTVSKERFEWLVPGLFREKLTFLLKSLPKSIRKRLVPVSDAVDRILDDIDFGKGPLYPTLENSIQKLYGFLIDRSDWTTELPIHLTPRYMLIDMDGRDCFHGRTLHKLLANSVKQSVKPVSKPRNSKNKGPVHPLENRECKSWDFAELPTEITIRNHIGEATQILYPALEPLIDKSVVKIIFIPDYQRAKDLNREGLLLLYRLHFAQGYKALKKLCNTTLSGPSTLQLMQQAKNKKELTDLFLGYVLFNLFPQMQYTIPSKEAFAKNVERMEQKGFYKSAQEIVQDTMALLRKRREISQLIEDTFSTSRKKGHPLPPVKDQFFEALDSILPLTFLAENKKLNPQQIERQLRGLKIRLERFYVDPRKDQQKQQQLTPFLNQLHEVEKMQASLSPEADDQLINFKEMVNDYRLALFSPEIRGGMSVSPKKLEKQWRALRALC